MLVSAFVTMFWDEMNIRESMGRVSSAVTVVCLAFGDDERIRD